MTDVCVGPCREGSGLDCCYFHVIDAHHGASATAVTQDDWYDDYYYDDVNYWDDAVSEENCTAGGADLFVDAITLARSIEVEWLSAADVDPCYIEEGCLSGNGTRKLVRLRVGVKLVRG